MASNRPRWGVLGLVLLAATGCPADAPDGGFGPAGCVPGTSMPCICLNGVQSSQVCNQLGNGWDACRCDAMPTPPGATPAPGATAGAGAPVAPLNPPPIAGSSASNPALPTGGPMMTAGSGATGTAGSSTAPMGNAGALGTSGAGGMSGGAGTSGAAGAIAAGDDVPMTAHCQPVAAWDPMWVQFEEEVLMLTNQARARGADCGQYGSFGPAGPLTMQPNLRCSARLHSQDMGINDYFAHESQDGTDPFQRMSAAGYSGRMMGENIAKGQQTPMEVVNGWMDSDGHCSNIMNAGFTDIGIGYWEGEADNQWFNGNKLWTQNFGSPGGFGRP